jgi:hypothetical protein
MRRLNFYGWDKLSPERIKEVDDEEAEVALQPLHIVIGAMEHLRAAHH